jgi:hypothetical protein
MPTYTRDELKVVIQDILGDGFVSSRDESGFIDPNISQRELLRFAALSFLQNPDTIFYLASIFIENLKDKVDDLVEALDEASVHTDDTIKKVTIPSTDYLTEASTALGRASTALEAGSHSGESITRAKTKITSYTSSLETQLFSSGSLSNSADVAKSELISIVSDLWDDVSEILTDVSSLINLSIDTRLLEKIYLAVTVDKIQELLDDKIETITEATTQYAVEQELRSLFLFLKTINSLLGSESDYPSPFDERASGTGSASNSPSAIADTIEPAILEGTASVPVRITPTWTPITLEINGSNQALNLPLSTVARITGGITENYTIVGGTNDGISFYLDTYSIQNFTVTAGVRTAEQVGTDIENGTTPLGIVNATSPAEPDTVLWIESLLRGDGSRIIMDTATNPINSTVGMWHGQEARGSHSYPMQIVKELNDQLVDARAYTNRELKSSGTCLVDTGAPNKFDLPAGEGANVETGNVIIIKDGPNPGAYKIIGVATDKITVARTLWDNTDTTARDYEVLHETVVIESTKIDGVDSSLHSTIPTIFSFPTAKVYGKVSNFEGSQSFSFVRAGDTLTVAGSDYTVERASGNFLVVSPLLDMDVSNSSYVVNSPDEQAYSALKTDLEAWETSFNAAYPNFNDLNAYTNRVRVNPSIANRNQLKNELAAIKAFFSGSNSLSEYLEDLGIRDLPSGERLLKLLDERKSSRGKTLLTSLDFTSFFDFDAPLSYEQDAFEKLSTLLKKYSPIEAITDEIDDEILEDSSTSGVEFEPEEEDILDPEDEYFA